MVATICGRFRDQLHWLHLHRLASAATTILRAALLVFILFSTLVLTIAEAQVRVRGYHRKDGTYVQPHVRSRPDGNPYNNYSYPGNYNPNTGSITTGNPDTYLRNYYGRGSNISPSRSPASAYLRPAPLSAPTIPPIAALQHGLITVGFDAGVVDGKLGPRTVAALTAFQRSRSLPADGRPSRVTIDSLITSLKRLSEAGTSIEMEPEKPTAPLNAHPNYSGTGWECDRGYRELGGECVAVQVPVNAQLSYSGHGWDCQRGYGEVGNQCLSVVLPANAQLNYSGHGWDCQRGYREEGSQCLPVMLPTNAQLNYSGHGWDCERGYREEDSQCLPVVLPAYAQLNYSGHGWDCQRGYREAGNQCLAVVLPADAQLNYSGHGWDCQRGYREVAGQCLPVRVPSNGRLDYSGHSWECLPGFRRVAESCIPA